MLKGKNILLGVTAGIAAYKSTILIRLLVKAGANVRVIMTPSAKEFITPLTLSVLSKNPVLSEFSSANGSWNNHVELGMWADVMVIAPATADIMAKMAAGICDNLLLGVYLSAKCRVYFAPAMDLDMYKHPSVAANIKKLVSFGNMLIPAEKGELASGLEGVGRMAEPEQILSQLQNDFKKKLPFIGKKALVTAGPTFEKIDPIRFIGNHSSGKMGFAIAGELAKQGADVKLICGPNSLFINSGVERIDVVSAEDMFKSVTKNLSDTDILVMTAAVADFTPVKVSRTKIKKNGKVLNIQLKPTKDILSEIGKTKKKRQVFVGFAVETNDEVKNAKGKLKKKNLDLIVLNSLNDQGAGFGYDTNKIKIIDRQNKISNFELKHKTEVAKDIVAAILNKITHA